MRLLKPHAVLISLTLSLLAGVSIGQTDQNEAPKSGDTPTLFRPRVFAGAGPLTYFGDVGHLGGTGHGTQLNWGYSIGMENRISDYFSLNAFMMFGTVRGEEHYRGGIANFETSIGMGGINVAYNFGHLMDIDHPVRPYVSAGITTFEFNPKADMHDAEGNAYHYWSDGTVRDRPEYSAAKDGARILERDGTYETDLRRTNDEAPYALRSFSVPVGAGFMMRVNDHFDFKMGAEFHYVFTDNLDNISSETGDPRATGGNDHLLYSSVGLVYNLHAGKRKPKGNLGDDELPTILPDMEDEDLDGIVDLLDHCPFTPPDVAVDERGCPVDSDGDGIADHLDREPNTAPGAFVDEYGVALSDADIENMYLAYLDSTGALQYNKSRTETDDVNRRQIVMRDRSQGYRVEIGASGDLSQEDIAKLLSIADLKSYDDERGTVFYLGDFEELGVAVSHGEQLANLGFTPSILHHKFGQDTPVDVSEITAAAENFAGTGANPDEVVFRVQIGAYRYALSNNVFKDIPNLLIVKGNDGLTRYVSGSFQTIQEAAEYKVDLLVEGYEGAFVTAYRGGKRITLREAGARMAADAKENIEDTGTTSSINADFVKFTVQLGSFEGRVPAQTLSSYMELNGVRPLRGDNGTTTYIMGQFDSRPAAERALTELREKGFDEATVVGLFNSGIITADEAVRIKEGK